MAQLARTAVQHGPQQHVSGGIDGPLMQFGVTGGQNKEKKHKKHEFC
jgi:hypothetical protein